MPLQGHSAAVAFWQDQLSIPGATITAGYTHFAVADPEYLPTQTRSGTTAGESIRWQLPAEILRNVTPNRPQAAVVQIDARSQGNRGLAYTLNQVQVHGVPALAERIQARVITAPSPDACVPGAASPLYAGGLLGAAFGPRELVTSAYTFAPWTEPETAYLCLDLSIPKGPDSQDQEKAPETPVEDGVTTTGAATAADGDGAATPADGDGAATVSDGRPGTGGPPAGARDAVVELSFSYSLYRPGSGP